MNPWIESQLKKSLRGRRILLGVTGSIAAFKACDVVRFLRQCEAEVRVVLSENAQSFVTPVTLASLSGQPVRTRFDEDQGTHHISTARWADALVMAPATANILGKMAHGLADDLLSTEALAFRGPVLVAPAMNPAMWANAAVQDNVAKLKARGVALAGPCEGDTACGEVGEGRMLEPLELVERIAELFYAPSNGKRALMTVGPTRSYLDPVRYFTNRSSGKMGSALAWSLARRGYEVTVFKGVSSVPFPRKATIHAQPSTAAMMDGVLEAWPKHDLYLGAGALLDWEVTAPTESKLKRGEGAPVLDFRQNGDLLKSIASQARSDQLVLGFAAETHDVLKQGIQKLQTKGCHAVFANEVSATGNGFESDLNSGYYITAEGSWRLPVTHKSKLAEQLVECLEGRVPPLLERVEKDHG